MKAFYQWFYKKHSKEQSDHAREKLGSLAGLVGILANLLLALLKLIVGLLAGSVAIVADALNLTLVQTENNDSSFGSAMCAGISAGFFTDFDGASKACQKVVGETKPIPENTAKYAKIFEKYKKISAFLVELSHEK